MKHLPRRARSRAPLSLLTAALMLATACARTPAPASEARVPAGECAAIPLDPGGRPAVPDVLWRVHAPQADRYELDEWCRGVGAPVVADIVADPVRADSIAVITWNIHLGAALVDDFVAGLRSGSLTGAPAEHFVLLLQEARRTGRHVPAELHPDARGARRLGRHDPLPHADIVDTARRLGLRLFYVPSMRNGGRDDAAEDRGNAILTSLPIDELTAIELPLLAQRRVAAAATVSIVDALGVVRRLRVASAHFDFGANASRPLAPFGPGRTLQAGALVEALDGHSNVVVGGDFNTWSLERLEGGLSLMQQRFPDFPVGRTAPTFHTAGIWPRRLDHLFLRAADVAGGRPVRIDDRHGSDHFPVLAWIRF